MQRICGIIVILICTVTHPLSSSAQAIDPQRSAKAAQLSDAGFIAANITANEDAMYLSRKGLTRATDTRVKELAEQMLENHTQMLYGFQQLENAGTGSHAHDPQAAEQQNKLMTELNEKLALSTGADFDSVWVASVLPMEESKYNEYAQAKETVTNPQLKMAISAAVPLLRKHVSQLKTVQRHLAKIATQLRKEEARKLAEERKKSRQ